MIHRHNRLSAFNNEPGRAQFVWATIENNVYYAKFRSTSLSDTMRETFEFVYSKCGSEKTYNIIKRIRALEVPTTIRVQCCNRETLADHRDIFSDGPAHQTSAAGDQ